MPRGHFVDLPAYKCLEIKVHCREVKFSLEKFFKLPFLVKKLKNKMKTDDMHFVKGLKSKTTHLEAEDALDEEETGIK